MAAGIASDILVGGVRCGSGSPGLSCSGMTINLALGGKLWEEWRGSNGSDTGDEVGSDGNGNDGSGNVLSGSSKFRDDMEALNPGGGIDADCGS